LDNVIVMYHYVQDNTGFKAFSKQEFREQVQYLKERYKIISLQELVEKKPQGKTCVLTFDDGIKDGFTTALPILEEEGLNGTFFVPTKIFMEKKLLGAQKRHLLLAKLGTKKFVEEFNKIAENVFQVKKEGKKNEYDDELTSNLKFMLDNMDQRKANAILDRIFSKRFNEKEEFEKIYLSSKEVKRLVGKGMEVGSHGHAHLWLGKLPFKDMEADLVKSVEVFNNVFSMHPRVMSYPFGSYSLFTRRLAEKLGFIAAVTTAKKKNISLESPLELGRYDCIDLFPRKTKEKSRKILS